MKYTNTIKGTWSYLKMRGKPNAYLGFYVIIAIKNDGTIKAHKGKVTYTFFIHNITPYKE